MPLPYRWQWRLDRWKNALRGFFGGEQQPRPKLCPACGALVGISATRCHECGASLRFSLAALSKSLAGTIGGDYPITTVVLILNLLLFGISVLATSQSTGELNLFGGVDGRVLYRLGARQSIAILSGEWWRLVLPIFLHGGLLHIGMNTMIFVDIGSQVEKIYGSARYLFIYVFTGICSFIASTIWNLFRYGGFGVSIGASGAIAGLIGVMLGMTTRRGGTYAREIRAQMIRMVLYLALMAFLPLGIDNAAHFGGLAVGFVLGKFLADREPLNAKEFKRAYALGWSAGLVVVASFVFMLLHFKDSLSIQ
ncbi:MAG TPA: rhomboid family intramembrane serine protease [Candidatus Limnocylindrales bacterium]|nr:rhomboid family intramembrane serine protease [Candidatus Limnocylindrales bacterium]